jgi:hypothetical protein
VAAACVPLIALAKADPPLFVIALAAAIPFSDLALAIASPFFFGAGAGGASIYKKYVIKISSSKKKMYLPPEGGGGASGGGASDGGASGGGLPINSNKSFRIISKII